MSTATITCKNGVEELERQIRRGKAVLKDLREALEDLEDLMELRAAVERNAGKPGTPWHIVAKELGL